MSNKNDEKEPTKEEEVKEEESKTASKKEEVKEKPKRTSKTTPKKNVAKKQTSKKKNDVKISLPLKTLVELVNESELRRKDLIILLDRKGYLSQFYEEEDKIDNGLYVKPTLSEVEFKKIIGE